MNFRTVVAGLALCASAFTAQAAPVLLMQAAGGVDLSNLVIGQTFQVEVIVQGDTPGEVDAGSSGGGGFTFDGSPQLNLLNVAIGTLGAGVDWSLDPSLFIIDFQAVAAGVGLIGTSGQCLNSNIQNYGCNFSSGPLTFVVRDPNRLPEPGSLALVGLTLLGLGAIRRRA